MPYRLITFGGLHVSDDRGQVVALRRHALALLARLAGSDPQGVRRDRILALLWPDSDDERARNSLRQAVYHIRRELHSDCITGSTELRLDASFLSSDVMEFDRAIKDGRDADAAPLYRGPFLDGFFIRGADELERWVAIERDRLRRAFVGAAHQAATQSLASDNAPAAVDTLRHASSLEPLDSRIAAHLIRATVAAGQPALALEYAEAHLSLLRSELDLPPDQEVAALVDEIRATAASRGRPPATDIPLTETKDRATPPASVDQPAPRRRVALRVVVGATAVIAAVAVTALVAHPRPPIDEGTLVVAPFSVEGPPEMQFLGPSTARLVGTAFDGFNGARVVAPAAVLNYIASTKTALPSLRSTSDDAPSASAIADHFRARQFVRGEIILHGDSALLRATLRNRGTAETIAASAEVDGRADDAFELADRLTAKLFAEAGGRRGDHLMQGALLTTSSLEAFKSFIEGEDATRDWRFTDAVHDFEHAVSVDSSFALAYYRLSIAADWAPNYELARDAADRALHFSHRLGEHERLLIRSMQAWRHDRFDEAEALVRRVVTYWRTDADGWYHLGEILFHTNPQRGRSIAEAVEPFERVSSFDPRNRDAALHLARLNAWEGNMARADSLLGVAIAALPDSASLDARLLRAFITRDPVAQRGVLAELRAQQDLDIYNECNRVAVYTHNLRDAETVCGLLIEPNRQITGQDAGRMTLAYLAMTQGQRSRARQQLAAMPAHARALRAELGAFFECFPMFPVDTIAARRTRDSLLVVDPSEAERALPTIGSAPAHVQLRLYFLARLDRCLGDSAAATAHIAELRRVSGAHTGRQALAESLRLSLDAELAGRSGAASQALGAIERVDAEHDTLNYDFLARIVNRFVRGEALVQSGRVDEGVSWLGSLEGNYLADLLLAPQGHLMSARALRERKDVNGEIGELTRALALWREPDVELRAVIGEAQARRSRLKH